MADIRIKAITDFDITSAPFGEITLKINYKDVSDAIATLRKDNISVNNIVIEMPKSTLLGVNVIFKSGGASMETKKIDPIKEVTAYLTEDGKLYSTKEDAMFWHVEKRTRVIISEILLDEDGEELLNDEDTKRTVSVIMEKAKELRDTLDTYLIHCSKKGMPTKTAKKKT